ncbi:ROK family protein, partial [Streptomyces niveus]|uniref:ROK family protein n=1 Tax=Streptomyces niveus TaxID=193462 RepID=UPI00342A220A
RRQDLAGTGGAARRRGERRVMTIRVLVAEDQSVRAAAEELIDRLGQGLAGLVNILNPDRVILGGLHRELLDADPARLRAVVADRSLWGRSGSVPILACTLDHNSLVGAAELAWQPVLDDPLAALT